MDLLEDNLYTEHAFAVPDDGTDVLLLAVVDVGYEIEGQRFGPEDRPG